MSKTVETNHIYIRNAMGGYEFYCSRCGDTAKVDTTMPIPVDNFLWIGEGFAKRHNGCKPPRKAKIPV